MKWNGRALSLAELIERRDELAADMADMRIMRESLRGLNIRQKRRLWIASVLDNELANAERQIMRYNTDIQEQYETEQREAAERRQRARAQDDNVLILNGMRFEIRPLDPTKEDGGVQSMDEIYREDDKYREMLQRQRDHQSPLAEDAGS